MFKRTIYSILFLIGIWLGHQLLVHSWHKDSIHSRVDTNYCQKWFDGLNAEYFNSALPPTQVIYAKGPDGDAVIGETYCVLDPDSEKPTSCQIYINPTYNLAEPIAAETVIHEACHTRVYNEYEEHGPRWQACMRYVADNGGMVGVW